MTETYVIDGVTYVTTIRNAKVGEKILIVRAELTGGMYKNGDVLTVSALQSPTSHNVLCNEVANRENYNGQVDYEEYVVLVPLKPTLDELLAKCTPENRHEEASVDTELALVEGTQASPAVIDMFTALSRKIVSLEKKLAAPLRDVQNNLEKQAIELENARHRIAKHADRFAAVEDKVEMLTDDTCELDERSQVLNAINRYYAEVYR
jgi:hypothetical protein